MPELPEVETIKNGLVEHILNKTFTSIKIYQPKLRWPIPNNLPELLLYSNITKITRRAKYLIISTDKGTLIIHLGMSGSLVVSKQPFEEKKKHDHAEFYFNDILLRYNDPRRFGAILWTENNPIKHKLLMKLGPEPLSNKFTDEYLYQQANKSNRPIKIFIMDQNIVVGVGNIYACESLFLAKICPKTPAKNLTLVQITNLITMIKKVLKKAIKQGGTTLKDFRNSDGKPGYFAQKLSVYGRKDQNCVNCQGLIVSEKLGQRSTFFCPQCQN